MRLMMQDWDSRSNQAQDDPRHLVLGRSPICSAETRENMGHIFFCFFEACGVGNLTIIFSDDLQNFFGLREVSFEAFDNFLIFFDDYEWKGLEIDSGV